MNEIIDNSVETVETQIIDEDTMADQPDQTEQQPQEEAASVYVESTEQVSAEAESIAEAEPTPQTQSVNNAHQKNKFVGFFRALCHWLFYLRKVFLALPVIYASVRLAISNSEKLPDFVGLLLQADGSFLVNMPRVIAVAGPLVITCGCLLMMFLSRKSLYAWAISIFSLTLPILLLVSNLFPA